MFERPLFICSITRPLFLWSNHIPPSGAADDNEGAGAAAPVEEIIQPDNSAANQMLLDYYKVVRDRVHDTSTSVRYSACGILAEFVLKHPTNMDVGAVCVDLLDRAQSDGDRVKRKVTETFVKLWFSSLDCVTDHGAEQLSHLVTEAFAQ